MEDLQQQFQMSREVARRGGRSSIIRGRQDQFKSPRELERRPPRPVRRRAGTLGWGLIFVRLFILPPAVVGLVLFLVVSPVMVATVFVGEVHDAKIVRVWMSRGSEGKLYHLECSYLAGGKERSIGRTISLNQYERLRASSSPGPTPPLKVRTINAGPKYFATLVLWDESPWDTVWPVFIAVHAVIYSLWLLVHKLWIAAWQTKQLCRWGGAVPGRIAGKYSSRLFMITTYWLDYEFIQPAFGLRKKQQSVPWARYHQAYVGEMVTVLCYPARESPTVAYEYGDFECA